LIDYVDDDNIGSELGDDETVNGDDEIEEGTGPSDDEVLEDDDMNNAGEPTDDGVTDELEGGDDTTDDDFVEPSDEFGGDNDDGGDNWDNDGNDVGGDDMWDTDDNQDGFPSEGGGTVITVDDDDTTQFPDPTGGVANNVDTTVGGDWTTSEQTAGVGSAGEDFTDEFSEAGSNSVTGFIALLVLALAFFMFNRSRQQRVVESQGYQRASYGGTNGSAFTFGADKNN